MPLVNAYVSLAEAKSRLAITDSTDDTLIEDLVTSVSRQIDDFCERRFYAATESRYYTALCRDSVLIDDCLSVSAVAIDDGADGNWSTSLASTDWYLAPRNASLSVPPHPYWELRATLNGSYSFPVGVPDGVKVTGSFGFAASTPPVVKTACLYQVQAAWDAKVSPDAAGSDIQFTASLEVLGLHPFAKRMLEMYRQYTAV